MRIMLFQVENLLQQAKVVFLENQYMFNHPVGLEKYDKTVRYVFSKVCNVNFDNISASWFCPFALLPAEMGGLGVSSASLLSLPAFLASAFGASDFLDDFLGDHEIVCVSFTKAFEKWRSFTTEQEGKSS